MTHSTVFRPRQQLLGRAIRAALISGLALGLTAAHAQDAEDTDAETESSEQAIDLGNVQVTARRREENLRDVPISVTTLTGEQLADLPQPGRAECDHRGLARHQFNLDGFHSRHRPAGSGGRFRAGCRNLS
jgi:hypothetical protein